MAIDTPEPSPFSHEILNANPYAYLDDAPLEERRARAVQMRRTLAPDAADGAGAARSGSDRARGGGSVAGGARRRRAARCAADAGDRAAGARNGQPFLAGAGGMRGARHAHERPLLGRGRAAGPRRGVCPDARIDPADRGACARARHCPNRARRCAAEILRGWFECAGPPTAALARELRLPAGLVDAALAQLEAEGQILRGKFTPARGEVGVVHTGGCWRASTG